MANVIIVLLIVAYCAWVIYTHFFRKKDGHKCSGICAGCSQCSSPLDDYYRDQKKMKERHNHGWFDFLYVFRSTCYLFNRCFYLHTCSKN